MRVWVHALLPCVWCGPPRWNHATPCRPRSNSTPSPPLPNPLLFMSVIILLLSEGKAKPWKDWAALNWASGGGSGGFMPPTPLPRLCAPAVLLVSPLTLPPPEWQHPCAHGGGGGGGGGNVQEAARVVYCHRSAFVPQTKAFFILFLLQNWQQSSLVSDTVPPLISEFLIYKFDQI